MIKAILICIGILILISLIVTYFEIRHSKEIDPKLPFFHDEFDFKDEEYTVKKKKI